MTDRNFRDRGGRGRDWNWEEDRYENSGYGRTPHRFENEERGEMNRGYGATSRHGFDRESSGSREWNEGWGRGAGEDFNRGGYNQWSRGGSPEFQGGMYGSSLGRSAGMGQHSGKGPKGWKRSDERIAEEVNEALARHPELDASEIEVTVKEREVKLTGIVEDRGQKRLAEDVAEEVFGVEDVDNDLKIRHGFLAGLTGEKADEREIQRSASREPTLGTTGRGTTSKGRGRSELDRR